MLYIYKEETYLNIIISEANIHQEIYLLRYGIDTFHDILRQKCSFCRNDVTIQ